MPIFYNIGEFLLVLLTAADGARDAEMSEPAAKRQRAENPENASMPDAGNPGVAEVTKVFLVDKSGSMNWNGGWENVKKWIKIQTGKMLITFYDSMFYSNRVYKNSEEAFRNERAEGGTCFKTALTGVSEHLDFCDEGDYDLYFVTDGEDPYFFRDLQEEENKLGFISGIDKFQSVNFIRIATDNWDAPEAVANFETLASLHCSAMVHVFKPDTLSQQKIAERVLIPVQISVHGHPETVRVLLLEGQTTATAFSDATHANATNTVLPDHFTAVARALLDFATAKNTKDMTDVCYKAALPYLNEDLERAFANLAVSAVMGENPSYRAASLVARTSSRCLSYGNAHDSNVTVDALVANLITQMRVESGNPASSRTLSMVAAAAFGELRLASVEEDPVQPLNMTSTGRKVSGRF